MPEPGNLQIVADQATDEHDLHLAAGRPGAQDDLSLDLAATCLSGILSWLDPELPRAITGRRSAEQLDALGIDSGKRIVVLGSRSISVIPEASLGPA